MTIAALYPLGFLMAIVSLTLWFRYQEKAVSNFLQLTLLLGLLFFSISWYASEGEWVYKFSVLLRDSLIMALAPLLINRIGLSTKNFAVLMIPAGIALSYYHFAVLQFTFPQNVEATDWELLVELKPGTDLSALEDLIEKHHLVVEPAFPTADAEGTDLDDFIAVNVPEHLEPQLSDIMEEFSATGLVDYAETNETIRIEDPTEALRISKPNKRYGMNDPLIGDQWGFESLRMEELYRYLSKNKVRPKKEALIAILDTGVDAGHEDLKANFTSTDKKYDTDVQGHGTHCAGIAAAVSNNGKGVASISPSPDFLEVTSIKVLSNSGIGTQRGIINGIIEAADRGADVISMSLGGRATPTRQRAYNEAVAYANKRGAIVVVAAGNNNGPARQIAPANAKGVITVTAIGNDERKAPFSNTIEGIGMSVAAPGVNIMSTWPNGQYEPKSGTSMATPYVSGLVGLMKSIEPDLTTEQAFRILKRTGKQLEDSRSIGGMVQPAAAISELVEQ